MLSLTMEKENNNVTPLDLALHLAQKELEKTQKCINDSIKQWMLQLSLLNEKAQEFAGSLKKNMKTIEFGVENTKEQLQNAKRLSLLNSDVSFQSDSNSENINNFEDAFEILKQEHNKLQQKFNEKKMDYENLFKECTKKDKEFLYKIEQLKTALSNNELLVKKLKKEKEMHTMQISKLETEINLKIEKVDNLKYELANQKLLVGKKEEEIHELQQALSSREEEIMNNNLIIARKKEEIKQLKEEKTLNSVVVHVEASSSQNEYEIEEVEGLENVENELKVTNISTSSGSLTQSLSDSITHDISIDLMSDNITLREDKSYEITKAKKVEIVSVTNSESIEVVRQVWSNILSSTVCNNNYEITSEDENSDEKTVKTPKIVNKKKNTSSHNADFSPIPGTSGLQSKFSNAKKKSMHTNKNQVNISNNNSSDSEGNKRIYYLRNRNVSIEI